MIFYNNFKYVKIKLAIYNHKVSGSFRYSLKLNYLLIITKLKLYTKKYEKYTFVSIRNIL